MSNDPIKSLDGFAKQYVTFGPNGEEFGPNDEAEPEPELIYDDEFDYDEEDEEYDDNEYEE